MDKLKLLAIDEYIINECVDLFIDTFTREPWYDSYDSRDQVVEFFQNHMKNNYFLGYAAKLENNIVALSIGMKKPWLQGLEYYIDEFCVSYDIQGKGIGAWFLNEIEQDINKQGISGIMLNTERDYPSHRFYQKCGFKELGDVIILVK